MVVLAKDFVERAPPRLPLNAVSRSKRGQSRHLDFSTSPTSSKRNTRLSENHRQDGY